ncbi:hypothetical protein PybrP1_003387 [[Pythium] brassicae (nom. inval.)]|nr:hypothetical protein PybrP1_003387 [[Pythium] brassicae (nom. inval.)]
MTGKRKAEALGDSSGAGATGASLSPTSTIEQQLCAHAASAYNDFVRFFQRRTSELIAANRMRIVQHQRAAVANRRVYPSAATLPHHRALLNVAICETSEALEPPAPSVRVTRQTVVGTPSESATLLKRAVVLPRVPATPNSTMWTALSKNYDVEDQPQLKFLPYFGDDDEEDVVSEFYQIKCGGDAHLSLQGTSALEVEFAKEICEAVLQQLHSTWQLTARDLTLVAATIQVEPEVVAEIHKKMRASQKRARKKKRQQEAAAAAAAAGELSAPSADAASQEQSAAPESMEHYFELYESSVDSYRTLFCRRCYKYDCDYHGCLDAPKLDITEQNAVAEKIRKKTSAANTGRNCGNQCFLGRMGASQFSKARAISTAFGWDSRKRLACARAYFICSGNFCDVAKMLGDKTCLEVAEFCDFYEINEMSLAEERKLQWKLKTKRGNRKKKMTPSISHLQFTNSRLVDGVPTKIEPCAHVGPCDQSCSCIVDGVFCSKLCNCVHRDCQIFYHGCKCLRGRCRTKACPCFAAGRECDLDLCVQCCAEEIAQRSDPERKPQGYSSGADAAATAANGASTSCQNRNMALGNFKHMRVGRSTTSDAGWGLFVDEFVAKDEFLIEYIGEMVTHEEAERRGAVYDKLNRSYLFNLDSGSVVDSTRKGNKTRFINHDSAKPNCFAKIVNVNSNYRIGMYALRDIEPHTELFFDYRYDQEFHNVNLHKQPTVTEWIKETKEQQKQEQRQALPPRKPVTF